MKCDPRVLITGLSGAAFEPRECPPDEATVALRLRFADGTENVLGLTAEAYKSLCMALTGSETGKPSRN